LSGDRGAVAAESKPLAALPPAMEAEERPVSPPNFGVAHLHNPAPPYVVIAQRLSIDITLLHVIEFTSATTIAI